MRLIRQLLVGKRYHLFPIFILSVCLINTVQAGQWQNTLYSLLGFPKIQTITFAELNSPNPRFIQVRCGYDDIYRKKINGSTTLTIAEQCQELRFGWPLKTGKIRHELSGEYVKNYTYFNNLNDSTSLVSRLRVASTNYTVGWRMQAGIFHCGGRYENGHSSTPFTIDITAFPHSENATTNQYFFDLLEPTFGRELTNTLEMNREGYSVWVLTRLGSRWYFGTTYNYTEIASDWQTKYVNSGLYEEFAGNRQIDLPVKGQKRLWKFNFLSPRSGLQELALIRFTDKFSYFIDNNRPNDRDKSSLGNGNLNRSGLALTSQQKLKTWRIDSGVSVTNYDLHALVNTPALGYQKIILVNVQIVHQAEFNFSRGRSFSQKVGVSKLLQFRNFSFDLGAEYTHTIFDFQIEGIAKLMCGIVSTDIDYPFKYSLHLLDLHAATEYRLGPLGLTYAFRQWIPAGKRLDDSPIRFIQKMPGVQYTNRGGQQHQLDLSYYF